MGIGYRDGPGRWRVTDGDVVDLISDKDRFIARGLFNSRSQLRVRLYTWDPGELLDEAFFRRRLETAIELRRQLGYTDPRGAARLVFSEGDGLSGLIVDRYGEYLAIQATSLAIWQRLDKIVPLLVELLHPRALYCGRTRRGANGGSAARGSPHLGRTARWTGLYRRARVALRCRFARGAQNGLLSGSTRKSSGGRKFCGGTPRARHVLLQRRFCTECRQAWRSERSCVRR